MDFIGDERKRLKRPMRLVILLGVCAASWSGGPLDIVILAGERASSGVEDGLSERMSASAPLATDAFCGERDRRRVSCFVAASTPLASSDFLRGEGLEGERVRS